MKNFKTSKIVLIILAIFIVTFTITCLWLFYLDKQVSDALIMGVFGLCGSECGVLGWIKVIKTKHIKESEDKENDV